MLNYEDIKHDFLMDHQPDPWGNTMSWLFAVSEVLHFDRDVDVPWNYRPSPIATEPENNPQVEMVREMPTSELLHFGRVLARLESILKTQGWGY